MNNSPLFKLTVQLTATAKAQRSHEFRLSALKLSNTICMAGGKTEKIEISTEDGKNGTLFELPILGFPDLIP